MYRSAASLLPCPEDPLALLAVLQHDARSRARLASALGREHALVACASWDELCCVVAERPVEACIVDPYGPHSPVPLPVVKRLRQRHPALAVIVYADFCGRELHLFHLGRLGVNAIIMAGRDDSTPTLRAIVAAALAESVAALMAAALNGRVPERELLAARWAVEHAHEGPRVKDLAAAFGVSRSTLNARLRAARLPSAGRLLIWGKLLRAARWLEEPGRTVEAIAYRLGYGNAAGFRRALRRRAGATPSEVTRCGGVRFVLDAFMRHGIARDDGAPRRWIRSPAVRRPRRPAPAGTHS